MKKPEKHPVTVFLNCFLASFILIAAFAVLFGHQFTLPENPIPSWLFISFISASIATLIYLKTRR